MFHRFHAFVAIAMIVVKSSLTKKKKNMRKVELKRELNMKKKTDLKMMMNKVIKWEIRRIRRREKKSV